MNLPSAFQRYREPLDKVLRCLLVDGESPLYSMLRYHLGWADAKGSPQQVAAGKALRPTLCLLACDAVGGDQRQALPAAAALELLHNFSLVHDDIQDGDLERHHRPTVWALWGQAQGIAAGNALRALASLALLRLDVPESRQVQASRLLDEACLEMIEGQYLDLAFEGQADITPEQYLAMIARKTAALIRCALQTGALLGGAGEEAVAGFGRLGEALGLAFQIRDDVLGIWGDTSATGKPIAADMRRRKKTFPVVYALGKSPRGQLRRFYGSQPQAGEDVAPALAELEGLGAQEYAQQTARHHCSEALAALDRLALAPACRSDLEQVAHFLVEREY